MTKPVLLTPGSVNHRSMWKPLSDNFQLAFMDDSVADMATNLGVEDVLSLKNFSTEADISTARNKAMLMAADLVDAIFKGAITYDESVPSLHGLGLATWLPSMAHDLLAPTMGRISSCARLAEQYPVVGLLVHEDVTMAGRALTMWGNAVGVPTLHMPHANHFAEPGTDDIHCKITASHLGVAGEHMEKWYEACGADSSRMRRVGVPHWDRLYDQERLPSKAHARRAFGVPDGVNVLGYATTWYQFTTYWGDDPETYLEESLRTVCRAARHLGAFMLLKMHPGEAPGQEEHYAQVMEGFGVKGAVTRGHLEYALRASDCVVTQGPSNVAIDAGILGTPAVEFYVPGARYPDDGPEGTWGDDLVELVDRAVVKDDFVRRMNEFPGDATDQAVRWVRETLL